MNSKLSLILSVYKNDNVDHFVESVNSCLDQIIVPNEIIIVVDGPVGNELNVQIKNFDKYQSKKQIDPDGVIREPFKEKQHKIDFFKNEIKFVNSLNFKRNYKPKYLDLGCGTGFITSAINKSYIKYGLEVGKESYNFAKKYFDYMHLGELKEDTYKENFFDVIMFQHVLEHLPNPIEILDIKKKFLSLVA